MKNTIYLLLLALLPMISCNKDKDKQTSLTVGRWKIKEEVIQGYVNGSPQAATTWTFDPTDYFDFKGNGTAEAKGFGRIETFPYAIAGDTITINQTKGKINTLTANTFSYTLSDTMSSTHYTKVTWNLYK